jgi:hypothetical protein
MSHSSADRAPFFARGWAQRVEKRSVAPVMLEATTSRCPVVLLAFPAPAC